MKHLAGVVIPLVCGIAALADYIDTVESYQSEEELYQPGAWGDFNAIPALSGMNSLRPSPPVPVIGLSGSSTSSSRMGSLPGTGVLPMGCGLRGRRPFWKWAFTTTT